MELVLVVRIAEVAQQSMDAVRVERQQILSIRRIAMALQVEHQGSPVCIARPPSDTRCVEETSSQF